jgi:hypothetical protein
VPVSSSRLTISLSGARFPGIARRHFVPIIDSLRLSTKTRPTIRSNRLLEVMALLEPLVNRPQRTKMNDRPKTPY